MIANLRGVILEKHPNQVVLEAGGVGYDVQIPISTYSSLPSAGQSIALRIHTHVREDTLQLFGFATPEEKVLFEKLISVSGIGPKLGITVLSGLPAAELVRAIRASDVQTLVRIPGVGKKTAERIVLELKDKVVAVDAEAKLGPVADAAAAFDAMDRDVLSALQNLGCSRGASEEAVKKIKDRGAPDGFEPYFRAALAVLR